MVMLCFAVSVPPCVSEALPHADNPHADFVLSALTPMVIWYELKQAPLDQFTQKRWCVLW